MNSHNKKIFVILCILFSVLLIFLIWPKNPQNQMVGKITENPVENEWNTYVNEEYNFSIEFPTNWELSEHIVDANPVINIYKPKRKYDEPPYDHFDDIANVSIFPNGVPTEGVFGEKEEVGNGQINYLLDDGQVWAIMKNFDQVPDSWQDWGFVWAKTLIEDLKHTCEGAVGEKPIENCNPFEGDVIVRSGNVDSETLQTAEQILETFTFLD